MSLHGHCSPQLVTVWHILGAISFDDRFGAKRVRVTELTETARMRGDSFSYDDMALMIMMMTIS